MSYTITLTSSAQIVNHSEDTLQLQLVFTIDDTGSNESYSFAEKGLRVIEWGTKNYDYDFEDALMVPGTLKFSIGDMDDYLDELFFGTGTAAQNLNSSMKVILKLNAAADFTGYVETGNIIRDVGSKIVRITVFSKTEDINLIELYDETYYAFKVSGISTTPEVGAIYTHNSDTYEIKAENIDSGSGTLVTRRISGSTGAASTGTLVKSSGVGDASISFSHYDSQSTNPLGYNGQKKRKITEVIEDIFKVANSSLSYAGGSINIFQDWTFKGERQTDNLVHDEITFYQLYQDVDPMFFDSTSSLKTLGDVLKKYAIDWGCFTGLSDSNQAFFHKLFYYDSSNLQTLTVYAHEKGYRNTPFVYVRIKTPMYTSDVNEPYEEGTFTRLSGRYLERDTMPGFYDNGALTGTNIEAVVSSTDKYFFTVSGVSTEPAEGSVYSNNGSEFTLTSTPVLSGGAGTIYARRTSGSNNPTDSFPGTLTKVSGTGDASISFSAWDDFNGTYNILQVKSDDLLSGAWCNYGELIANFWYTYRANLRNCRIDRFRCKGIDYDFFKSFNYNGYKYQIIKMEVQLSQNITEIEAIYLGAV